MISSSAGVVITGGIFNNINQSKRGIDILMDWVATDAFHNSKELYDAPKCHPHTRVAVLTDIMNWVIESEAQEEFILWLFGSAGAGKSAIAKKIAELAAENGILIGSFFFSRTSPTRSTQDRLVATLAYQMTLSIPGTRPHIEDTIDKDPAIFHKDIQTQIDALLIKPFQFASTQTIPTAKLIIIDGLDECSDRRVQVAILDTISRSFTISNFKLPIRFLIASRPETDLVTSFNSKKPLKSIHRRLALDDSYHPDDDIRLFFSDKFEEIRCTHRLGSTLPIPWPPYKSLNKLINKSSGQFIYAATVVRFVESNRHRPAERLNIVLGISLPRTINPFSEMDALYKHILSSVDDISVTLRVLSLYASSSELADKLGKMSEQFLSLEEGDMDRALIDLSSIVSYVESSGKVKILHASLVDFLSDTRRSNEFYIDMASAHTDFACRTLQYVKGPDGIRAGDVNVFVAMFKGNGWILTDQLKREILDFDLDAFLSVAAKSPYSPRMDAITKTFIYWVFLIDDIGLEDVNKQLLICRCRNTLESRIQKYQSDWRLRLLLTLSLVMGYSTTGIPRHRRLDILLEIDDDDVHLVDQNALDLRYSGIYPPPLGIHVLRDITSRYVDGDSYAAAALHCMSFLANPPNYSENESYVGPETSITYAEWKATCHMALLKLCGLLERANTSPELITFMNDHDINAMVQKNIRVIDIWRVDIYIVAFLNRGSVCVNWRIISAVRRALSATNRTAAARPRSEMERLRRW